VSRLPFAGFWRVIRVASEVTGATGLAVAIDLAVGGVARDVVARAVVAVEVNLIRVQIEIAATRVVAVAVDVALVSAALGVTVAGAILVAVDLDVGAANLDVATAAVVALTRDSHVNCVASDWAVARVSAVTMDRAACNLVAGALDAAATSVFSAADFTREPRWANDLVVTRVVVALEDALFVDAAATGAGAHGSTRLATVWLGFGGIRLRCVRASIDGCVA